MRFRSNKTLRLSRAHESHHFVMVGDTGTGKTTLVSQIIDYVERSGDVCVILDAKLELTARYYNPKRGDHILSPKDARCPYWHIGAEITDYADAMSVTRAMYPSHPGNPHAQFFDDQACRVGAFLLVQGSEWPSCAEYGKWLADPVELGKLIKGTMHQVTLDPKAAGQFAGVASTMNMVGDALRMMPVEEQVANQLRFAGEALATMPTQDGKRDYFTVKDWCANRKGWIFLPNPAVIREALRPLQSMWADMIMLGLMKEGNRADLPRVWLIYDEVDSLNTLPQLHTAITEMRSAGNPIVLGLQNMAQLEDRYGRQAETIFSQPYTKIVFATSHGKSAETLSKLIGDCEYVRYREVRTGGLLGGQDRNSFSGPEEVRKPLLLPSEIQSLRDLEGYVMQRGRVVKFKLPYSKREETTRGWIERIIPPEERLPQPAPVEADTSLGWTGTPTNPPGRTSDSPLENKSVPTVPAGAAWMDSTVHQTAQTRWKTAAVVEIPNGNGKKKSPLVPPLGKE